MPVPVAASRGPQRRPAPIDAGRRASCGVGDGLDPGSVPGIGRRPSIRCGDVVGVVVCDVVRAVVGAVGDGVVIEVVARVSVDVLVFVLVPHGDPPAIPDRADAPQPGERAVDHEHPPAPEPHLPVGPDQVDEDPRAEEEKGRTDDPPHGGVERRRDHRADCDESGPETSTTAAWPTAYQRDSTIPRRRLSDALVRSAMAAM